jgi:hypothetical protein
LLLLLLLLLELLLLLACGEVLGELGLVLSMVRE